MQDIIDQAKLRLTRLLRSDPMDSELFSAIVATVWAVLLLGPPDVFGSTSSYALMAALPGWLWGLGFMAVAAAQVLGTVTEDFRLRRGGAMAAVMLWGLVGWLLLLGNPMATGGYVYLAFAAQSALAYVRLEASRV